MKTKQCKVSGVRCKVLKVLILLYTLHFTLYTAVYAESFSLFDNGEEDMVNYNSYGEFCNVGTENYKYQITDREGLSRAVGEGIYPNTNSVLKDPSYRKMKFEGKLDGDQWNFVDTDRHQTNFYKWATTGEEPGVKLFYIALALEKAGLIKHAIKAYYSIVVHFPKTIGWTFWNTPWYVGPVAIDKIHSLCRKNPELGMKLIDAKIKIRNRYDDIVKNDIFICNPGKIVRSPYGDPVKKVALSEKKIIKRIGKDRVQLVQYENGHWQLLMDNKPYLIKAVAYSPNKVGLSPDNGTLVVHRDWMINDFNKDGIIDAPYQSWVDKNRNNKQDNDEPDIGDFQLLKDMGANTIRLYHHGYNKKVLMDAYKNYGIMFIMGDFLGMYTVGSEAPWYVGTDYTNPKDRENMKNSIKKMVMEYKDEPYILMWMLGNENNYGVPGDEKTPGLGCQAKSQPEAYYSFVNEIAKMIKSLDDKHPVAICNGDILYLDKFAKLCPDVDIFGANSYRGPDGFGTESFWECVKEESDKPAIITEYGCPAYMKGNDRNTAEKAQAEYHRGCWEDIQNNSAGSGVGNSIGGVVFEWCDEWWKGGPPPQFDPSVQDTRGNFRGPFPDGWLYEEWLGLVSQGDGKHSPYIRQLRQSYYLYQKMWKEK